MKRLMMILLLGAALACGARAQGTVRPPDKSMTEEAQAELTARHDLEVARQYFKLRKAYVAALSRAEELVAGYPTFSKRDEALYIAGMSSLYLADGKGKQKFTEKEVKEKNRTPEQLRLDAREYLSELVNNYPKSEFFAEADKELKKLGNSNSSQPAKAGDSIKPRA